MTVLNQHLYKNILANIFCIWEWANVINKETFIICVCKCTWRFFSLFHNQTEKRSQIYETILSGVIHQCDGHFNLTLVLI